MDDTTSPSMKLAGLLAPLLQIVILVASIYLAADQDSIGSAILVFFVAEFVLQIVGKLVFMVIVMAVAGATGELRNSA